MTQTEDVEVETVVETDNARSGVTSHHVRYVLAFGIAGVVVAMLVIGMLS